MVRIKNNFIVIFPELVSTKIAKNGYDVPKNMAAIGPIVAKKTLKYSSQKRMIRTLNDSAEIYKKS